MFNDICFYVKGNMIKVNGQDFLLGRAFGIMYEYTSFRIRRDI